MIGKKIRKLRIEHNLTQKQLAELSMLHPVTIRKYETNKMMPQIDALVKMAKVLNVPLCIFLNYKCKFRKDDENE